ncbi:hypothetical protein KVR01_012824 [Diaporthe batatas]|uniref:uncharacterized protein n=1 Tax=Diaporthe batatas TaxID=748121 RepID=UPI001D05B93D|nr:uncharacterized protein KVR01_012824 [Diaporthe batatas]KAG8157440.1 hypothetical protein KVR01_012824 [Diaporthe batatas]
MSQTVILITGGNRGLGEGLVRRYLAQPNHTVIAGNRNPAHPTSKALSELPVGDGSKLIVVKIDATVHQDAFDAVKELEEKHGIEYLDIVIPNAGISNIWPPVLDLKLEDLKAHTEPNVYGFISLYQATRALLKKSTKGPQLIPMGSNGGDLTNQPPIPNAAYGPTKAAVNWLTIRINTEDEWLNAWVINPGWVQTDLGNAGARALGLESAFISVDESCDGMVKVIASSTKEKYGGKKVTYNGDIEVW